MAGGATVSDSDELNDPGHVAFVRRWLTHNADKIAETVEPPSRADRHFTGADFVKWVETLLSKYHTVCQRDHDRTHAGYSRFTGD
jgi:hypothetical protein